MDEERISHFRSRVVYDLKNHKTFSSAVRNTSTANIVITIIILLLLGFYCALYEGRALAFYCTVFSVTYSIAYLLTWLPNRNGGTAYKRALYQNGGEPPVMELSFEDGGIRCTDPRTGTEQLHAYNRVVSLVETKELLLIRLELRMYLVVNKNNLEGGTTQELVSFLRARCPVMKRRIRTGRLGRWLRIILCGAIVSCVLCCAAIMLDIPAALSGQITNRMTYLEIAEKLEPLGITGATPEMQESLNEFFGEYYTGIHADYYNKATDLLAELGMGTYDPDTWEWTPSRNGVYWLDMEAYDVEAMYTDFLRGISALNPDALRFTEIVEDHSRVSFEEGIGIVDFSFCLNGVHHCLPIRFDGDWINTQALGEIAGLVNSAQPELQLYFASDEGQGLIVFYRSESWAKEFTDLTKIPLYKSPELIWYE